MRPLRLPAWAWAALLLIGAAASSVAADPADPFAAATVTAEAMNQALGSELWTGEALWDEEAAPVAARLGCRPESQTASESSFRLYPKAEASLFGARPYSVALYARDGKPERLSVVFANKGDYTPFAAGKTDADTQREFTQAVTHDAETVAHTLTALLGAPRTLNFGAANLQEKMRRWDWNGHAFLLAAPRDEYVVLRILPAAEADRFGRADGMSNQSLRELLTSRVARRPNGDVVIGEIPMVDQGPKGYCVPATWERYLRYQSIPADMYVLAMAGGTLAAGGTDPREMVAAATQLARSRGLMIVSEPAKLTVETLARDIDQGLPLMWTCYCPRDLEKRLTVRAGERKDITDWDAYRAKLQTAREAAAAYRLPGLTGEGGHMRMIVGYNAATDEIAISDSWGAWAAERWITPEEASAVSAGEVDLIKW